MSFRKRLLRIFAILLLVALFAGYFAFSTFLFSPLEGDLEADVSTLVPRDVDFFVAKAHLANSTRLAPGVYLPDGGHIVIGAHEIGTETVIQPRVTIGMGIVEGGPPRIGSRVWIGSDSVIYGAIVIGDGATILPGTVVTKSIPPGAVVSGNPPRLVASGFDNSPLRSSLALGGRLASGRIPGLPPGVMES